MKRSKTVRTVRVILLTLCAASFILAAGQAYFYMTALSELSRSADTIMSIEATRAVEQLAVQLRKAPPAGLSQDALADICGAFRFGDTGYGYLLSREGKFLYHPIRDAVESQRTIFEILSERKTPQAEKIIDVTRKALAGGAVSHDITNPETGQNFRLLYRPVADTGWVLAAVFSKDEMSSDGGFLRRQKMWTTLWLVLFVTLFAAVLVGVHEMEPWKLWLIAATFSILSALGALFIWYLTLSTPLIEEKDKLIFNDVVSLKAFVNDHSRTMLRLGKRPPAYIPTGIYIQSLEFTGANDLDVTGYVWQHYTDGLHDAVTRGFIMPEARELTVKEAYRRKVGATEVIGWYFEAVIRQRFDYSRYPFDRPNIWIWLRPSDFANNVVLVPDLAAYKFLAPSSLPGLQEEVALPGYTFLGTFFDREFHLRRTNYGMQLRGRMDRVPELYYNIIVKRNFLTPFVARLFPLFIMFSILFVVQLMFSHEDEKKKAFGFNALAVMGVVITFFFSTLLSHNNLRQELGADKIIFIENFHFIAYSILLLVAIKTLLFMGGNPYRFVQYRNGLIPKLLYWPLCTGLVFIISFVSFY